MICVECLSQVTSACETKRKCLEADETLRRAMPKNSTFEVDCTKPEESRGESSVDVFGSAESEVIENDVETGGPEVVERKSLRKICRKQQQLKLPPSPRKEIMVPTRQKQIDESVNSPKFRCDVCGFVSKRKKNVERHILGVHLKVFKFYCPVSACSRQYTTRAALNLHCIRDHDGSSQFQCEKCFQKFSCDSLLKIHNQRLTCRPRSNRNVKRKVAEKSLACPHCDFRTAHQFSLTQHVNLIHLNIRKTFKCSHCARSEFSNRISLNQHLFRIHNLTHIRCSECDQAFSNEAQLNAHKKSLKCNARKATFDDFEETESGVKCNLCHRSYRSKKEWTTHYFNHHKFNKVCDICNVQLSTYASLKNHKKTIHEKIKSYACTECPKQFSAKHTLTFHLNSHSGIKPFGCKFCPFKASDRSSVSKHQKKLHTDKA